MQRTEFNIQTCICPTLFLLLHPKYLLSCVAQAQLSDSVGQEQEAGHQRLKGRAEGLRSPVALLDPSCSSHMFNFFALDAGACRHVASQFRELTWMETKQFISAG